MARMRMIIVVVVGGGGGYEDDYCQPLVVVRFFTHSSTPSDRVDR